MNKKVNISAIKSKMHFIYKDEREKNIAAIVIYNKDGKFFFDPEYKNEMSNLEVEALLLRGALVNRGGKYYRPSSFNENNVSFSDAVINPEDIEVDLTGYATKDELNTKADIEDIPTKLSDLQNDKNFLTSIPSEYVTDTELNNKGYLTQHQSLEDYATKSYVSSEIAKAQLEGGEVDLDPYALKEDIPTKLSDLQNDSNFLTSIPSEYVTDTELNNKGYLTQHQSLEDYATKSYVSSEIAKAQLEGGEVDLDPYALKEDIPTKLSDLQNDKNFLTSIPSEYVTDTELQENLNNYADKDDMYVEVQARYVETQATNTDTGVMMISDEGVAIASAEQLTYTTMDGAPKGYLGSIVSVMPGLGEPIYVSSVTVGCSMPQCEFAVYSLEKLYPDNPSNHKYTFTKVRSCGIVDCNTTDKTATISFPNGEYVEANQLMMACSSPKSETTFKGMGYRQITDEENQSYVYYYATCLFEAEIGSSFQGSMPGDWCGHYTTTYSYTQPGEVTPTTNYTITNNISNARNSNTATTVTEGSEYSATISAYSGYTLNTVKVTMGGTDITSSCYSNGVIHISNVTGDIVITANATLNSSGGTVKRKIKEVIPGMLSDINYLKYAVANPGSGFSNSRSARIPINKYFVLTVDDLERSFLTITDRLISISFYPALALKMESINNGAITWDEVKQLQDMGFEIAFHGMLHSNTPAGTAPDYDDVMIADIQEYKNLCKEHGIDIVGYCGPNHYPLPVGAFKEFEWARSAYGVTNYGWNINYTNASRMSDTFASITAGTSLDWSTAPSEEEIAEMIALAQHENLRDNYYLTPMCHSQNIVANIDSYMRVFEGWIAQGLTPMRCRDAVMQSLWKDGSIGNNSTFEIQAGTATNPYWILAGNGTIRSFTGK